MAQIVTVGGSISGLAAALVLSASGHHVTVLERDPDPTPSGPDQAWSDWPRRGVPHLRGTHVFGARGLQILRDHLPDVLTELKEAGGREVLLPGPEPQRSDGLSRLACRRTTYEMTLRKVALRQPSIRFEANSTVVELVAGARTDARIPHVAAVRTGSGRVIPADLVVDASGRNSMVARSLALLGARVIPADARPSGMAVNTRWYRLRDRGADPGLIQVDLGYGGAILSPADDGMFSVTIGVFGANRHLRRLRQPECLHAAAAAVAPIAPWLQADVSTPVGRVQLVGNLPNRLQPLTDDQGRPAASGVVRLGDAAMCTNPRFGRGVSLALVHAVCLARALEDHQDPVELVTAFAAVTERELHPWFHDAVARDAVAGRIAERVRAGEPLTSIGAEHDHPEVRLARATPYAIQHDPVVAAAFQRVWHLVEPPSAFADDPEIRSRIEAVWRDRRGPPPAPPGPAYRDMLCILAEAKG